MENLIKPHGGYRQLKSYQTTEIICDYTVEFCWKFIPKNSRTIDQMVQAARSGKQNIAEGSQASGSSKKTELTLVSVARASLEELLLDYQDFLRQHHLPLWEKDSKLAKAVRHLSYTTNKSYETYSSYITQAETAANCAICLIHQANYLLDKQLIVLQQELVDDVGIEKRLKNSHLEQLKNKTSWFNKQE